MRKQILISLSILLFLLVGTTLVVLYAKGYRFEMFGGRPKLAGTGLLVATSIPNGAEVFINGHLDTATDNTINLPQGEYDVKIRKDGYFPWEKKIQVQTEVVAKAEALLFPTAPKLENITSLGVENPVLDPTQTKIAFKVSSQSAKVNGIYVVDMAARPILSLQSSSTQIADDLQTIFSQSDISWSADGADIIATSSSVLGNSITYLLKANSSNQNPQDITDNLDSLGQTWQMQKQEKEKARLLSLKPTLRSILLSDFSIHSWSPDETKLLYTASRSAQLPAIITPPLIGDNSTPEERSLKQGKVYVYDIKEDRNYPLDVVDVARELLEWFPDSRHLIYVHDKRIDIMEYDGLNRTTVYAGPFVDNYIFPSPNQSNIVILTNLNNLSILPNLYTVGLK